MANKAELLQREKEMLFQEKLAVVAAAKHTIGYVGLITGLLFTTGYQYKIGIAFLLIPPLIQVLLYFLLANLTMMNLICWHLERLDAAISALEGEDLPFYHQALGARMRSWGFNMTPTSSLIPNPYYFLVAASALFLIGVYALSVREGASFLLAAKHQWAACWFARLSYATLAVAAAVGLRHFTRRDEFRASAGTPRRVSQT